ncbi:toll-like receptor Tollo isoform X1 [Lutzomyia longipalpis]|nr:toll-like receptor Tollo isoform X1 [Lutzomyia longipalpis]XP_055680392.1 toll-like receptor Tollo isoform X1 [Lutzomyia longipalpis]XP_055680393.1 toll-like receptor Tollo isoform X1 [Lutzomyia longipalpis]XP_055680394.1 toll-like receptor Tollo isoform X1 [Lutzomyia longipalpis]XP_055680395.1 toll-like receptor Tollo isoform X1 [Lutzomyia longipalpis]XP_055680396.1 toll-like receptor Tollo isoform X1 [Lutzomyia longipalpis]
MSPINAIVFLMILLAKGAQSALQIASCDSASSNTTHCVFTNLIGINIIFKARTSTDVPELESVEFRNCNLPKLPLTLFTTYTGLTRVDISKCQMRQLNGKTTLMNAKKLKILDMSENNLDDLPDGVFSEGAELVELYLARNQISTVSNNAFAGLKKLELLDLSFNTIKTIRGDVFWDLRQIKFIYINNNAMSTMRINFVNCTNLIEYDGSHNDLTDWSLTFPGKSKVVLNLSYTKLKNTYSSAADKGELIINGNAVDYIKILGQVSRVSAKYNKIRYVEIDPSLPIYMLEFTGNFITDIGNITKIKTLEKLDLSENRLLPLTSTTFSKMEELRVLSLRSTGIAIDGELLTAQKKLIFLDISGNELTQLNLRHLKALTSLKTLFVHENKLTELQHLDDIKEILPSLTTISLSKNRFTCTYLTKMLQILENLKVNVLLDTKNLATSLNTNVLGIDCFATDDVASGNTTQLEKMLIFRETALDLENRFSRLFKNIETRFNDMVGNLMDILQSAVKGPGDTQAVLGNILTNTEQQSSMTKALTSNLENITKIATDVADFREKIASLQLDEKLKMLLAEVIATKRASEEGNQELIAKLTSDQIASNRNMSDFLPLFGNISEQLRNISSAQHSTIAIDELKSDFSSWKYFFLTTFICSVLVCFFIGFKLYQKRLSSLSVSRVNLASSEMI